MTYDGILSDLFREGQGIVAQGVIVEPTKIEAFEVLAKHDENYMPPEIEEAMKRPTLHCNTRGNRNKEATNDC